MGSLVSAGLPNITGVIDQWVIGSGSMVNSGAFSGMSGGTTGTYTGSGKNTQAQVPYFNASYSNSIYGSSETVTPASLVVNFYIHY